MKLLSLILQNFKNIVVGVLLILVAVFAHEWYRGTKERAKLFEALVGTKDLYVQLSVEHAQLASNYVSQKKLHEGALKRWDKERKDLKGQIAALASATFTVGNFPHEQDRPDVVTNEFIKQEVQYKKDDGSLGPPVGYVQIFSGTGKTVSGLYAHDIQIDAIVTKDATTGRYRVLTKGSYILRDENTVAKQVGTKPDWTDVPYPLSITGGEFWIDPTMKVPVEGKPKFRWAPKLNVGGFVGMSGLGFEGGGRAGVSLWGYGHTENDLDFKFGEIGVNGSRGYIDGNLTPISWRVGNVIPLIDDLYVGPGVGFGNHGVTYFLGFHTTL